MIEIYKYNPSSTWFQNVVNDSALKGKKRDIAIENAIKEHGMQISIVEYFKDWNRNSYSNNYRYDCYGEAEDSIERLVNAEINYDENLAYLSAKNNYPEDLIESRTSWDEMKDYANGLYRFINSVITDVVIGKIIVSQNTWKPSDEQLRALNYVVNLMASSESLKENDYYYNVFKDLREQLKELKEE